MKIKSVFTNSEFKLILEFDNGEYRLLDINKFLHNDDMGRLAEIRDDINMFKSVKIDKISGAVTFGNGVDFDNEILYKFSINIGHILGNEGGR